MNIAYTLADGRNNTNLLLSKLAVDLQAKGLNLAGTVQTDTPRLYDHRCDMDVRVLPNGPIIRISQSLGTQSSGCRLDPAALEEAVALTLTQLSADTDLLIINKFGKHEADGRGFRDVITRAVELDIPMILGANKLNLEALQEFCPDIFELQPTLTCLTEWAQAFCHRNAA